ncbi:cuticle protein 7-like [Cherax quadricarinatus]|uniref:cuticle protein 7-like n=1 Tax=Cherax quadricarinatus TaxID=27406 RepID=UPI00387E7AC9
MSLPVDMLYTDSMSEESLATADDSSETVIDNVSANRKLGSQRKKIIMKLKVFLIACILAVAAGEAPVHHSPPAYPAPSHYHKPHYPEEPPKYTFNYGVADHYGANFGHSETRDGYRTEGSYSVDLPDGRKQTVNYQDNGDGLEAVVNYEGEAQYPAHKPSYPAHPTYKPSYPSHPTPYPPPPHYE